jgi:histidinol phosphatase-like PHP family hydrolase
MLNIDIHIHTVHSDGELTVAQVAKRARRAKITCGVADHLSPYHRIYEEGAFDEYVADVRAHGLLLGAEYCIGQKIPVDEGRLSQLDYLLGGVHSVRVGGRSHYFWGDQIPDDVDEFAAAYLELMCRALAENPLDVLAHPTYVPLPFQNRYDDVWTTDRCRALWECAAAHGVAVEISGRWLVPRPMQIKLALDMGLTFAFGSDTHRREELFNIEYPLAMAEKFRIPEDLIFQPRRRH